MLFKKQKRPAPFNIKPRYWDPEKEEREDRERRIKTELGMKSDDESYVPNIKGQFRRASRRLANGGEKDSSGKRLIFIIILLCLIVYIVYKLDVIADFINKL